MSFWTCWKNRFRCTFLAPPKFDLTGVRYRVVYGMDVRRILLDQLIETETENKDPSMYRTDAEYLLYPETVIMKVARLIPAFYDHRKFLKGKLQKPSEGSDCDNSAEMRSYFFHLLLPGCCAISISQPVHRFTGVVSMDGGIIWFNGNPSNKEYVHRIFF